MVEITYENFIVEIKLYKIIDEIGQGRFGTIYLAEKKEKDGKVVKYAIRRPDLKTASGEVIKGDDLVTKRLFREVETFIQIKTHPVICKFYGFTLQPQNIILEYLPNGSLQTIFSKLLNGKTPNNWNGTIKSKTVFGIACALQHLQNQNAFHRYLTPSSILYDANFEPRLVDFAYSKVETANEDTKKTLINTNSPIYQAPELETQIYDWKVDNFSYGVILYQIATGKEAFNSKLGTYRVQQQIAGTNRPPLSDVCPRLANMIDDLWQADPKGRPDLIYIIKSLNDYDEPLFPETDMDDYSRYRERILKSTDLSEEQLAFLNQPKITAENTKIFEHQKEEAERGSKKDMLKVARSYEKGIGTERDIEEAIAWYEKAANEGEPEALYKLSNFYCIGKTPLKLDNDKYIEFLKKASDKNYPPASVDYAFLLLTGYNNVKKDETKALEMFKKLSDPPFNIPEAMYRLAQYYESKSDAAAAIKYYNMARDNGLEAAHCDYALMLLDGDKVDQDINEGMKIMKQAADRGFPMANYNLGHIYEFGKYGQEKNPKLSFEYYKAAADQNMPKAMVKYARALFKGNHMGYDVEKNPELAARLFQYTFNKGEPEGIHCWASFIQNGYGGTPINIAAAMTYYKVAAERGFIPSMLRLGDLYNLGVSGSRNPRKAREYYTMAKDHGSRIAEEKLKDVTD